MWDYQTYRMLCMHTMWDLEFICKHTTLINSGTPQKWENLTSVEHTVWNMQLQKSYNPLWVTKSLGNVIKMQYAYIIYPAAMIRCLQKRIWSWSTVTQARHKHSQTQNCSVSWTKIWGFQKVHGKLWESRLGQGKLYYLLVFWSDSLLPGFTFSCRSVSLLWVFSVSQLFSVLPEGHQVCLGFSFKLKKLQSGGTQLWIERLQVVFFALMYPKLWLQPMRSM